jgi:endogenous inhibitor of DNA gyrase (YacG/DUF329 family)
METTQWSAENRRLSETQRAIALRCFRPFGTIEVLAVLRPCPECKKSVSDSAETCPHCGYRLLGRANLVPCPHCGTEVLPEVHPHDTISRYCPLCKRPITSLTGRRIFFAISGLIFVIITVVIVYVFSAIRNAVLP